MTRTTKWTVHEKASEPRYFTHNGHFNMDPNKVCKQGNGKFNWGKPGDELLDDELFMKRGRRNSNHAMNEQSIKRRASECDASMNDK